MLRQAWRTRLRIWILTSGGLVVITGSKKRPLGAKGEKIILSWWGVRLYREESWWCADPSSGKGDLDCLVLPISASTYIPWATEHMRGRKEKVVFDQGYICNFKARQAQHSSQLMRHEFGRVILTHLLSGTHIAMVSRNHYYLQD